MIDRGLGSSSKNNTEREREREKKFKSQQSPSQDWTVCCVFLCVDSAAFFTVSSALATSACTLIHIIAYYMIG
jgi:hypothetical protein